MHKIDLDDSSKLVKTMVVSHLRGVLVLEVMYLYSRSVNRITSLQIPPDHGNALCGGRYSRAFRHHETFTYFNHRYQEGKLVCMARATNCLSIRPASARGSSQMGGWQTVAIMHLNTRTESGDLRTLSSQFYGNQGKFRGGEHSGCDCSAKCTFDERNKLREMTGLAPSRSAGRKYQG